MRTLTIRLALLAALLLSVWILAYGPVGHGVQIYTLHGALWL